MENNSFEYTYSPQRQQEVEAIRNAYLPKEEKLQQAAEARLENPEASLTELAAMMEPPITKPAMNHRLKKLVSMAQEANT